MTGIPLRPRCACGRRIIIDRHGVLHDRCGTCRRAATEQAQLARRVRAVDPHCEGCGDPLKWSGRGRAPKRCGDCRREQLNAIARERWKRGHVA